MDAGTLDDEIRRRIALAGPMPVRQFMTLCLTHPERGYYTTRDPFGRDGDFITAPEVSQMFGELIGLWAAAVWRLMGEPENVRLVELGPGRGTMMADALRAAQVMPAFRNAIVAHLVEISPALARAPAPDTRAARAADAVARHVRGCATRPGHRARQRVLRRAADSPSGQESQRLVRAHRRDRPQRQLRVRHRRRADPAVRSVAADEAARSGHRLDLRVAQRSAAARARSPRGARRRRRADRGLRPRRKAPPARPSRRSATTVSPIR